MQLEAPVSPEVYFCDKLYAATESLSLIPEPALVAM